MKSLRTIKLPQFIKEEQATRIYQKIGEFPHTLETAMNLNEMM